MSNTIPGRHHGSLHSFDFTDSKGAVNIDDSGDLWLADGCFDDQSVLFNPDEALELLAFLKDHEQVFRDKLARPSRRPAVEYRERGCSTVQAHDHQHGGLRGHSIGNIYPLSVYAVVRNGKTQWKVWNTLTGWTSQEIWDSAEKAEGYAKNLCSGKETYIFAF